MATLDPLQAMPGLLCTLPTPQVSLMLHCCIWAEAKLAFHDLLCFCWASYYVLAGRRVDNMVSALHRLQICCTAVNTLDAAFGFCEHAL